MKDLNKKAPSPPKTRALHRQPQPCQGTLCPQHHLTGRGSKGTSTKPSTCPSSAARTEEKKEVVSRNPVNRQKPQKRASEHTARRLVRHAKNPTRLGRVEKLTERWKQGVRGKKVRPGAKGSQSKSPGVGAEGTKKTLGRPSTCSSKVEGFREGRLAKGSEGQTSGVSRGVRNGVGLLVRGCNKLGQAQRFHKCRTRAKHRSFQPAVRVWSRRAGNKFRCGLTPWRKRFG